jgi:transposase-like protein
MKILCPVCNPTRLSVGKPLIWQPAKLRYWCRTCGRNFTLQEAAIVPKPAPMAVVELIDMRDYIDGGWK